MKVVNLTFRWGLIIVVPAIIVAIVAVVVPARPVAAQCGAGYVTNPAYTQHKKMVELARKVYVTGYVRDLATNDPERLQWVLDGGVREGGIEDRGNGRAPYLAYYHRDPRVVPAARNSTIESYNGVGLSHVVRCIKRGAPPDRNVPAKRPNNPVGPSLAAQLGYEEGDPKPKTGFPGHNPTGDPSYDPLQDLWPWVPVEPVELPWPRRDRN